jgi:hypothetical protein
MLAHVVAANMGKTHGQMIFGGLEDKGAPIVVCGNALPSERQHQARLRLSPSR